jgi:hypothetical protein
MGNTQSEEPLPDDFKPILEYKDLEGVANYIKSGGAKKIIVMVRTFASKLYAYDDAVRLLDRSFM